MKQEASPDRAGSEVTAYCLMLLGGFFIFSIYVLIMQSNRQSKNPPEAVIARFENDI